MEREIENHVTGDRIYFRSSPLMGDGDQLIFRTALAPFAVGAPLHQHDAMTESFEVVSGTLEIDLGGSRTRLLHAGGQITLAPGTPHGFRNPLARETVFITSASPGIELERFLRSLYGLANDGLTNDAGNPNNPLALAIVLDRMDMTLSGIPRGLQRLLTKWLGAFARRTSMAAKISRHIGEGAA